MKQSEVNVMASDALNVAVKYIQDQLNIKTGDFAGFFFSEGDVQNILAEYIRGEISNGRTE
jgi:hypothetical protein